MCINALFFSDNTMHKIYLDEGDFNFIYQIPQIIYSTIISSIISIIIKILVLSEKEILELKREKKIKLLNKKFLKLELKLKIKFAFYLYNRLFFINIILVLYNLLLWNIYQYSKSFI